MTPSEFRELVDAYCTVTGGSSTSCRRTRAHNAAVGGVTFSAHLVGLAEDVVYDNEPPGQVRAEWARRLGLKLIVEGDHDHLQPADWQAG